MRSNTYNIEWSNVEALSVDQVFQKKNRIHVNRNLNANV